MADVICGDCGAPMVLRRSAMGPFWGCTRWPACPGKHGAHPDGRPKGVPGDAATRAARIRAHEAFDPLWKGGELTRRQAYSWLAKAMGKSPIHIGELGAEDCERVVVLCAERTGGPRG
jgi:ssDNA-binding Zn-finger/Zn-ribbon topoisomerase 1